MRAASLCCWGRSPGKNKLRVLSRWSPSQLAPWVCWGRATTAPHSDLRRFEFLKVGETEGLGAGENLDV